MWGEVNACTLTVGMLIGTTTVENSMGVPQEIKNSTTIGSHNPTRGHISQGNKTVILRKYCIPTSVFNAALFTIIKEWEQPVSTIG